MFMGSTLLTPLYVVYQDTFGFSGTTLTLIYATYVIGNLTSLFVFGRVSDQLGRRRTVLPLLCELVTPPEEISQLGSFRSVGWGCRARICRDDHRVIIWRSWTA